MALHQILPAAMHYSRELCNSLTVKKSLGVSCNAETVLVKNLSLHTDSLFDAVQILTHALETVPKQPEAASRYYHDTVMPGMIAVRLHADALEKITDKSYWPYPTYSDLLYY